MSKKEEEEDDSKIHQHPSKLLLDILNNKQYKKLSISKCGGLNVLQKIRNADMHDIVPFTKKKSEENMTDLTDSIMKKIKFCFLDPNYQGEFPGGFKHTKDKGVNEEIKKLLELDKQIGRCNNSNQNKTGNILYKGDHMFVLVDNKEKDIRYLFFVTENTEEEIFLFFLDCFDEGSTVENEFYNRKRDELNDKYLKFEKNSKITSKYSNYYEKYETNQEKEEIIEEKLKKEVLPLYLGNVKKFYQKDKMNQEFNHIMKTYKSKKKDEKIFSHLIFCQEPNQKRYSLVFQIGPFVRFSIILIKF